MPILRLYPRTLIQNLCGRIQQLVSESSSGDFNAYWNVRTTAFKNFFWNSFVLYIRLGFLMRTCYYYPSYWRFLWLFFWFNLCCLEYICWLDVGIQPLYFGIYVKTIGFNTGCWQTNKSPVTVSPSLSVLPVSVLLLPLLMPWPRPILLSVSHWYFIKIYLIEFTFPVIWVLVRTRLS